MTIGDIRYSPVLRIRICSILGSQVEISIREKSRIRNRIKVKRHRQIRTNPHQISGAKKAQNEANEGSGRSKEVQNGAVEDLYVSGRRFASL
jgi:hypothetical protein